MDNCLKKKSAKLLKIRSPRRLLASLFVFMMILTGAWAENYTWNGSAGDGLWNTQENWTPNGIPGEVDQVTLSGNENITLSGDVKVNFLFIFSGTNSSSLDLAGNKLTVSTRIRLGQDVTGNLILTNGTVTTAQFDTEDYGSNSLTLNNVSFSVSSLLLANGTGTTTIDGTGSSSFTIPASYAAYGPGNTLSFTGSIQPTVESGTYTITSSGVPAPGATITITISNQTSDTPPVPVAFTDITFKATYTGTGETYKVNGTAITNAATTISNSPAASTMTITVELPPSIEPGNGISLALYEGNATENLLGTPLFYTQQSENTSWTGSNSDWNNILNWTNGIPAKNMNAIIPGGVLFYPNLESNISAVALKSVNLNATDSKLTIGNGGKIQTGSLINKGTLSNAGTISTGDFTNNTAIINEGTISITKDLTSTANITGTGTLLFTGTIDQIFTSNNKIYTNIIENKDGGSLTISGNCSINSFTIKKGTATTFSGRPKITTWSDVAGAGNLSFANGATLSSDTEIKTSGSVNLAGTFTTADLVVTNGAATLNGTFSSDSLSFNKAVTLAGNTTITNSAASETVHFADAITGASNSLSINTGATQFDGAVSGLSSLSTAAATINCASITSSGVQTYNGAITISQNTILSASEIDFLATIGSSNKLTVNAPVFKSAASADNTITLSEIEFAADTSIQTNTRKLTFDVTTISGTGKTISLSSGSKADLKAGSIVSPAVSNSGTITCIGAVTFNDAVVNTNGAITCNGAATFKGAYSGSGASLTLSSETSLFESDLDLSGTTFSHSNGTVQIGGSATGEVTIKGPQNFNNFETSRSLIIYGTNSFNDFTATNIGGKSLSFEAGRTQNINGNLSLSGTSSSSPLTLKNEGSGSWTITCSNPSITNVNVINSSSTNSIVAIDSRDSGHNTNWNFPGQEYTWTGNSSNDWNTAANWSPESIPGFGTKVTINPATNHPILTGALSLNQTYNSTDYTGQIIVAENAKFDLADKTLTVSSITNNGTVRLKGIANQITLPCTISNGTEVSTVEYHDTTSVLDSTKLAWGTTYKNLIISKPASLDDVALSVSNTTTIKPGTGKNVSLNNPANSFGDAITLNAGAVILNSSSDITIAANSLADSLSVTCADGKTININKITTTGAQTFDGTVTVASNTTLTAGSTSLIYFKKTVTGSNPLTISTANSQFDGAVTNLASLTTAASTSFNANINNVGTLATATANINCASVSTTGTQTYGGAVTVQTNTAFNASAGQLINFQNTVTGSGSPLPQVTILNANSQFDGTVSNLTSLTTAASASFNANISSLGTLSTVAANINCASVSTSGNQTYSEAVTLGTNTSLTSSANILFDSTVTGAYTLNLNQALSTTFNAPVQLTGLTDSTTHTGTVTFNAGGNISNATSFNTTALLTFGNDSSDTITFGSAPDYANLTHTAGPTSITGTVVGADITLGDTSGGPATITTPGVFLLADGKTLSYTTSFTQNGTGNSVLKGDFGSASGNGNAAFTHSVQLNASGASSFGTAGDSISITENLIITAPSAGLTINAPTTVNENIVMYTGAVTASANLTALNDILILGASYSETDTSTGITDEYSYTASRPTGWSTGNYNATQLPDRSPLPAVANYSASLQTQPGITVTAGKNFYANHTELKGVAAGQWILKLPDLTNPVNGYAEAYFTKVTDCKVICSDGSDDGSKARLITLEDTDTDAEKTTNTNVDFDDFKITSAFTVRDNAIRVEFNRPVRYHGTTIELLRFHTNTSSPSCNFTGLYSDPECQTPLDYDTQLSYFYIKAQPQDGATIGAWNTDASGKSAGAADEKSSDRHGIHHTSLPCLDFPRALSGMNFILTDRWGKRLNNYSQRVTLATAAEPAYGSQSSTFEVEDKTGPVLWTLRTGQELHTAYDTTKGEASQHSYDSHNFLEFRYSEQVDIGTHTASSVPEENIQVTDTLGAIQENISSSHNTLSFAGLSKINVTSGEGLKLCTGSNGNENKYVNALYRLDEYSVRLSIAGWTDGTITDYSGNEYKKWAGYIESATQFTGAAASAISTTNNQVVDLSGNPQIEYTNGFQIEPLVISNSSASNVSDLLPLEPDLYSAWDLSAPVFAPLRFSKEYAWGEQEYSEAVGNTNGTGSTLDRIDFHFFDNTPTYTSSDEAEWFTEIGWCNPGSDASKENLKDSSYTYCSDIIGGIRQFDSDSTRRTTGGIRMSTKLEVGTSFKYNTNPYAVPDKNFSSGISNIFTTIISTLFTGSSDPRRPVNDPDGLYLGLRLSDLSLPIETTFAFSFNEGEGYITDLAGNRLRSKTSKTIDRSAPSFDITLSPINQKEVILVFVKEVVTDSSKIKFTDDNGNKISLTQDFLSLLPGCFQIISINEDGTFTPSQSIQIDSSIPAELISEHTSSNFTAFRMTLTNPVTFDNIKNHYIQVKQHPDYPELSTDPFTSNTDSRVTLIQDKLGNYIGMYTAHALSDFAVGVVNPAYGYSPDMKFEEEYVMNGLYGQGTWAVHDWNADQQNYGTLPAGHPVTIVANTDDGTEEKLSLPENVRIYFSPNPQADSISTQLNKDLNIKLRVWLPLVTDGIIPALSSTNNNNFKSVDSKLLNSNNNTEGLSFDIPLEDTKDWKTGNQISFLFGILNSNNEPFRIYSSPYYDIGTNRFNLSLSNSVPLYCLRMHNISDISTLDLWSFKIKSITEQRGGVTILNNVINPDKGEKTVVKVNQPVNGKLNVIVMTLDGNIVTYLNRGEALAGEHFFTWNGKNKAGNSVARGMYFVRVIGGDFDETRKVMVVK